VKPELNDALAETIYLFKKSGGFNSDWDITYSIILFIFSKSPRAFQSRFLNLVNSEAMYKKNMFERLHYVKSSLEVLKPLEFIDQPALKEALKGFAERAEVSGISWVEERLIHSNSSPSSLLCEAMKCFLAYPGGVGESMVSTVFDEIFCGPKMFEDLNGFPSRFYKGRGLIGDEKTVVSPQKLDELAKIIGTPNFGIVSGRDLSSARQTLGSVLNKFKSESLVFLLEEPSIYKDASIPAFKKPNPLPLLRSASGLNPFQYAAYIGDSAEDVLMVNKANVIDDRYISIGVYGLKRFKEDFISHLIEMKTDIIAPSVNDTPNIIRIVRDKR
jgi:hypothetical protein